jgi:hypothetical protein
LEQEVTEETETCGRGEFGVGDPRTTAFHGIIRSLCFLLFKIEVSANGRSAGCILAMTTGPAVLLKMEPEGKADSPEVLKAKFGAGDVECE